MDTVITIDSAGAGFWQDNSLEGASSFLGKQVNFFASIKRHSPPKFKLIEELGKGSLVMGYIRLQTTINEALYNFGELYNILEEQEGKPEDLFPKFRKEIKQVRNWAFSSKEQSLNADQIKKLETVYDLILSRIREKHYLSEYNIPDNY